MSTCMVNIDISTSIWLIRLYQLKTSTHNQNIKPVVICKKMNFEGPGAGKRQTVEILRSRTVNKLICLGLLLVLATRAHHLALADDSSTLQLQRLSFGRNVFIGRYLMGVSLFAGYIRYFYVRLFLRRIGNFSSFPVVK